jgi:hypothetical protein
MGKDYRLTTDQQASIGVGEVARLIVEILQRNLSLGPDDRSIHYYPSQMSSIRQFELLDEPNYRHGKPHPRFRDIFQQAVDRLYHDGLIYPEPGQSAGDFYLLTELGLSVDPSKSVLGQPGDRNGRGEQATIEAPIEIHESLPRFRKDHPDSSKACFIMMKFGRTPAHTKIVKAIQSVLAEHGITALRADSKKFHPQLYPNIQTYMHGCSFGIAVIERLESNEFNPNVSLEVGYMLALRKPVCLLKDQTLPSLQSDLLGYLYEPFDPQSPAKSIPPLLKKWLSDFELV